MELRALCMFKDFEAKTYSFWLVKPHVSMSLKIVMKTTCFVVENHMFHTQSAIVDTLCEVHVSVAKRCDENHMFGEIKHMVLLFLKSNEKHDVWCVKTCS